VSGMEEQEMKGLCSLLKALSILCSSAGFQLLLISNALYNSHQEVSTAIFILYYIPQNAGGKFGVISEKSD
jgi:hypothetical protein